MSPVLTPNDRLYIPGAGGTVYYLDNLDADNATITGQLAFYGISNYDHSYDSNVKICTLLTSDSLGNLWFGFVVYVSMAPNLRSGIARVDPNRNGQHQFPSPMLADSKHVPHWSSPTTMTPASTRESLEAAHEEETVIPCPWAKTRALEGSPSLQQPRRMI
jgi:hypothetical protein